MRLYFLLILFVIAFYSCKKSDSSLGNTYNIENFRKAGMTDYQTIQAAVDSVPEESHLIFSNKEYIIDHTIFVQKSLYFQGPAVLKRPNQVRYKLMADADLNSTIVVLNTTKGLKIRDYFLLTHGQTYKETTQMNLITKISGDSVYLYYPLGKTVDGLSFYPSNTTFLKDIKFFWIIGDGGNLTSSHSCTFAGLTFNGNKGNNDESYSWLLNISILAMSKTVTYYKNCMFAESPGETIIGHNSDIRNCKFLNLNGSGFHTSADRLYNSEEEVHSYLYDNVFENTNQLPVTINGHDEGCITHSNSGGYYTAIGNTFINVGHAVLGTLYPSVSINDWGTSNITFTGNTIDGADRIVQSIAMRPGIIHDVRIEKNTISNMLSLDWSPELAYFPGIILKDKSGE